MAWVGLSLPLRRRTSLTHRPWPDTPLGARESPLIRWKKAAKPCFSGNVRYNDRLFGDGVRHQPLQVSWWPLPCTLHGRGFL